LTLPRIGLDDDAGRGILMLGTKQEHRIRMPEPPRMIPLHVARVTDLRIGRLVALRCRRCGRVAELAVARLRQKLRRDAFVRHLGAQFRCTACGHKGAEIDARRALGYYG
jgi:predicted RNA-binding Zn-ribbon protein involved in translation (DUF1610 family)